MIKRRIIAFFVIIALFIVPVSVFADMPIPAIPSDAWEYWVVVSRVEGGKNYFELFTSHSPITAGKSGTQLYISSYRGYRLIDNEWVFKYEANNVSAPIVQVFAANHNIAYHDGSGFFFTPPKVSPIYQSMKMVDFGMILRTFSAGLIPLVGLIVSAICLKKAWAFLRNQLMH